MVEWPSPTTSTASYCRSSSAATGGGRRANQANLVDGHVVGAAGDEGQQAAGRGQHARAARDKDLQTRSRSRSGPRNSAWSGEVCMREDARAVRNEMHSR